MGLTGDKVTELVTQAEYARIRGISRNSVGKAAKTGRITLIDGKVDVAAANIAWAARTDSTQQHRGAPAQFAKTQKLARASAATVDAPKEPPPPRDLSYGLSLVEEKTRAERIRIEKAQIELAQMRGELVSRETWERAFGAKLIQAAAQFQTMADRLAAIVAAESNPAVCHRLIMEDVQSCMATLSARPKQLPPAIAA